ncbi:MAG: hypothetical protein ACKO9V_03905, partial [Candidatus Kapaibacterium sp.]
RGWETQHPSLPIATRPTLRTLSFHARCAPDASGLLDCARFSTALEDLTGESGSICRASKPVAPCGYAQDSASTPLSVLGVLHPRGEGLGRQALTLALSLWERG